MAQLFDLPTETLLEVLSWLRGPRDIRTLLNLCLTSRRLRTIVQPCLFEVFYKYVFDYHRLEYQKRSSRLGPLLAFARTLALRPDLAAGLLRLCINANHQWSNSLSDWQAALRNDTIRLLDDVIRLKRIPCRLDRVVDFNGVRMNPFIVLIVALAPNLEHLDLVCGLEGLSYMRPLYEPGPAGRPPYLSGLKSLHIKDQAKTRHPNMKQLVEMMCLPELKEFSLAVCNGNGSGCPDFNLPPGSFRFSELQLLKATLSATQLTNIMRACNRLEVLVYESSMTWTNRRRTNSQFAAPELLRCLEPQKQNLKSLRVDLDVAEPIAIENWHRCPRYGSFREFENLKHLEVEQGILHEFRNLPPNIESVTVLSCDYPIYEMMDGLVQCYEVDFPCLENVFLRPKYPPASGMLDIPGTYSFSDLEEDYWFREQYKTGCCTLENIVDDVNFELEVDCDGWEMYKHGDL